jgi:hypothetical protein
MVSTIVNISAGSHLPPDPSLQVHCSCDSTVFLIDYVKADLKEVQISTMWRESKLVTTTTTDIGRRLSDGRSKEIQG